MTEKLLIDQELTRSVKHSLRDLHSVKTHKHRTREGNDTYRHLRSMGDPDMAYQNPITNPARVQLIESWLKGGKGRIGRATVILKYVFNGTSLFWDDEENGVDVNLDIDENGGIHAGLVLGKMSEDKAQNFRKDLIVTHSYKMRFNSKGVMFGTMSRRISDTVPPAALSGYVISEQERVGFDNLTQGLSTDFRHEPMNEFETETLTATLGRFVLAELAKVEEKTRNNILYHDEADYPILA